MTSNALTALILGNLIKIFVAREVAAMLASRNVRPPQAWDRCQFEVCVYGDTKEELIENRQRCRDAAKVFGVVLKARKLFKTGETVEAVPFQNDPFNQTKHYFSKMLVTYGEGAAS